MCAMNSFTSARLTSIAAAGPPLAHRTTATMNRGLEAHRIRMPLRPDEFAVRVQRHQYAEACQQRDHRRTAIADHRQRHADHGQDAAHHAGVDEHVDEEAERDGAARQARKGVLPLHREVQGAADDGAVQDQEHETRQQTEFFADDSEYEVGGTLRQEFQLSLTAHHVALAEHPARADGDLRLDDVVPRTQRNVLGIQKRQDALALVVVDEMPSRHGGRAQQRYRYQYDPQLHPGKQHHDEAGGRDQQGGAQVRLLGDHRRRNGDQQPHHHQILESRRQRALVHIPGAYHRDGEFHDLGRLEAHEADIEPTLRTLPDMTRHLDDDQQQYAEDVGDGREQTQVLRCRELGEGNHGGDRNGDIPEVMLDHFHALPGGAVHHQNPE